MVPDKVVFIDNPCNYSGEVQYCYLLYIYIYIYVKIYVTKLTIQFHTPQLRLEDIEAHNIHKYILFFNSYMDTLMKYRHNLLFITSYRNEWMRISKNIIYMYLRIYCAYVVYSNQWYPLETKTRIGYVTRQFFRHTVWSKYRCHLSDIFALIVFYRLMKSQHISKKYRFISKQYILGR